MEDVKLGICPEYVRLGENRCHYIRYLEGMILKGNSDEEASPEDKDAAEGARDRRETRQTTFCGSENHTNCGVYEKINKKREERQNDM